MYCNSDAKCIAEDDDDDPDTEDPDDENDDDLDLFGGHTADETEREQENTNKIRSERTTYLSSAPHNESDSPEAEAVEGGAGEPEGEVVPGADGADRRAERPVRGGVAGAQLSGMTEMVYTVPA